jgi:hypothetical protein
MNIRYLKSRQISVKQWDEWVENSINRRLYASSLFLDIFSPDWDALVIDDGAAFMPLTRNRKFFIRYLFQPIFVQQLGLFYTDPGYIGSLPLFIEKLSKIYPYVDIALNEMNIDNTGDLNYTLMDNYLLTLDVPFQSAADSFNSNTRRNIKKAVNTGMDIRNNTLPSDVVEMFICNQGMLYPNIRKKNYMCLESLLERGIVDGFVEIKSAYNNKGHLIAAACFIKDFDRYVFYFSANTPEGRDCGAMFYIIERFIEKYSGSGMELDFNGSANSNIARFYSGFGAGKRCYPRLKINNLRYPFRIFKR